jgi:hypothetical protein
VISSKLAHVDVVTSASSLMILLLSVKLQRSISTLICVLPVKVQQQQPEQTTAVAVEAVAVEAVALIVSHLLTYLIGWCLYWCTVEQEETMDSWDQAKLESVIEQKHSKLNRPTDIVCRFFLQAIEEKKYGWFWSCPNGEQCLYRYA